MACLTGVLNSYLPPKKSVLNLLLIQAFSLNNALALIHFYAKYILQKEKSYMSLRHIVPSRYAAASQLSSNFYLFSKIKVAVFVYLFYY